MQKKYSVQKKHISYRKKASRKRGILRWIIMAFLVALFVIFFTGSRSLIELYSLNRERNELIQKKEYLLMQNEQLNEEIQKLQSDEDYIEKIAREKFNMKKKNEDVYLIKTR
ncbi:MAG: hypothetical protein Kow0042_10510 [Calditrichia bacterium]